MARLSKKFKITKNLPLISGTAVAVIIIAALSIWHFHNRTNQAVIPSSPSHSAATTNNSSNSLANSISTGSDKQASGSNSSNVSSGSQNPSDDTGQSPVTPTGGFVSNHFPGGKNPTAEQSSCNTTPGASCYIKFTSGSNTKSLATQIIDGSGTTIWNWDAASFPSGTWQVTAIATLNGQTKTATDATPLIIQ